MRILNYKEFLLERIEQVNMEVIEAEDILMDWLNGKKGNVIQNYSNDIVWIINLIKGYIKRGELSAKKILYNLVNGNKDLFHMEGKDYYLFNGISNGNKYYKIRFSLVGIQRLVCNLKKVL